MGYTPKSKRDKEPQKKNPKHNLKQYPFGRFAHWSKKDEVIAKISNELQQRYNKALGMTKSEFYIEMAEMVRGLLNLPTTKELEKPI